MTALYSDTHPKMEALQIQLWRQASPTRKMNMLAQLNASARTLAMMGLRSRFPAASEHELRYQLAVLWLGEELARKVNAEKTAMQNEPIEVTLKVTGILERLGISALHRRLARFRVLRHGADDARRRHHRRNAS